MERIIFTAQPRSSGGGAIYRKIRHLAGLPVEFCFGCECTADHCVVEEFETKNVS
jgi:hypothetical protein